MGNLQSRLHQLTCPHVKRKILFRYLISEVVPPFFLGLLAFTSVLLIARILKLIELVVTRGVPLIQIGKLFSLILPTFLEMTVPMAFLLAILLGLGRMSNDHELLAMKASGVSPGQILWPIAALALVIATATLFLTMFARPAANFALKRELYNIAKSRVGTALKEKVFNDDFPKILIYVEEIVPPGNTAQGVLIVDRRDRTREDIILGKVARISTDEESNSLGLRLFDGSIYERENTRPGFSQTRFNIYDFRLDLDDLIGPVRQKESGPKEMQWSELLTAMEAKQNSGAKTIPERMELHQRISFAFAPLVFCMLGVSLALLPRTSRTNRSWGFMLCLFWLMTYYALLSLGKALGDKTILHPIPAVWLPNLVVGGIGLQFFRHALQESPLLLPPALERGAASAGRMLRKLKPKKRN
jgi:lipopolysaccharide export system permease protein